MTYEHRPGTRERKISRLQFFFLSRRPEPTSNNTSLAKLTPSTIVQKLNILFSNLPPRTELQIMTPFADFSPRKYPSIHHLRLLRSRETGEKVIKIRKSFISPKPLPLRCL